MVHGQSIAPSKCKVDPEIVVHFTIHLCQHTISGIALPCDLHQICVGVIKQVPTVPVRQRESATSINRRMGNVVTEECHTHAGISCMMCNGKFLVQATFQQQLAILFRQCWDEGIFTVNLTCVLGAGRGGYMIGNLIALCMQSEPAEGVAGELTLSQMNGLKIISKFGGEAVHELHGLRCAEYDRLHTLPLDPAFDPRLVLVGRHGAEGPSHAKVPSISQRGMNCSKCGSAFRLAQVRAQKHSLPITVRMLNFKVVMNTTIAELVGAAPNYDAGLQGRS